MLSLRVSRDKRGYDLIYLIWDTHRRGRPDPRLLYCCRLPSPLRVGPPPLDEDVRRALEQAHPDIAFDWAVLLKSLLTAVNAPRPIAGPPPPPIKPRRSAPAAAPSNGHRPGSRFDPSTSSPFPTSPHSATSRPPVADIVSIEVSVVEVVEDQVAAGDIDRSRAVARHSLVTEAREGTGATEDGESASDDGELASVGVPETATAGADSHDRSPRRRRRRRGGRPREEGAYRHEARPAAVPVPSGSGSSSDPD